MRTFRTIVSGVVALCLAVAPATAFAAASTTASPTATHAVADAHGAMPDCHGTKAKPPPPAEHQPAQTDKDPCPMCKGGVCASDVCQQTCFKVFGELPRADKFLVCVPARHRLCAARDFSFVRIRPPLPPPRA